MCLQIWRTTTNQGRQTRMWTLQRTAAMWPWRRCGTSVQGQRSFRCGAACKDVGRRADELVPLPILPTDVLRVWEQDEAAIHTLWQSPDRMSTRCPCEQKYMSAGVNSLLPQAPAPQRSCSACLRLLPAGCSSAACCDSLLAVIRCLNMCKLCRIPLLTYSTNMHLSEA